MSSEKKHLLVVDDDDLMSEMLKEVLHGEFHITQALTGDDALLLFQDSDHEYSVVLSDIIMPGNMTGIELLKEIRKVHPFIPSVILMTGYSDTSIRECYHLGAFAYIRKPFGIDVLLSILKHAAIPFETRYQNHCDSVTFSFSFSVSSLNEFATSHTLRLGHGGILLTTNQAILEGQKIRIDFSIDDNISASSHICGQVLFCQPSPVPQKYMIVIKYLHIPQNLAITLSALFVQQNITCSIPKEW